MHCYVNGGPAPMMALEDVIGCLNKLDEIAEYLPAELSYTLDHEPINHPEILRIVQAVSETRKAVYYHHGMTTGIALMRRDDKANVLRSYLEKGYKDFGITLHGDSHHHDEIVRRKGAHQKAVESALYARSLGASVSVSLMMNRYFPMDAEAITQTIERICPESIYFAIPIFTPHQNMMDFEPHRARLEDIEKIRGHLTQWRQNGGNILREASENTIASAMDKIRQGIDWSARYTQPQEETYLTVHADCKLYIGNSGAEVQCLGDLRTLDAKETAHLISELPGNRDYGAYYDLKDIPTDDMLISALGKLPQNLVYGDFESILYRGYVQAGIPSLIMK